MPEIKNTFLKGRMNKSLDDRILPEGEYRDAQNVQITKADGADVGVIHNIKGNELIHSNLGLSASYKTIGCFFDDKNDTIYWFVTNNSTSNRIYKWVVGTDSSQTPELIVQGSWLNFDSNHPITAVNVIENYLFWTDNLNPPRRINLDLASGSYYNSEDKVSVVKYAPYAPPSIHDMQPDPTILSREIEEKFVRFAYRYKFDDNTYSLISPFTAVAFVPKDYEINNNGNVSLDDENNIHETSEVIGMVNGINRVDLKIDVPQNLHIKEVDILYKESDSAAIRVLETKNVSNLGSTVLDYSYKSTLPKSTLPERQLTRVFDNVPTRALAQEIAGNRLIYGNITLGYNIPEQVCDYEVSYGPKKNTKLPRHSVKQRRGYVVGIVLSDKYGRSTPVILSENSEVYVDPKGEEFDSTNFNGEALKITFKNVGTVENPIAIKNAYDPDNNPFGWYSYKIVVKQPEQEYYNVYTRGVLDFNSTYIDLSNDNVNKVPRDDSNYNLENDKIASSSVRLYPKVLNTYSSSAHGGDYARSYLSNGDLIRVTSIGIANDLNLVTNTQSYITGMDLGPNPLMAKLSAKNIGAISSQFYKKLAVFETEPVKSSLDIYYETPTCGLVSELNDKLKFEGIDVTAISFDSTDHNVYQISFPESSKSGTTFATLSAFYDDDSVKTLLDFGVTYELTNPSSEFEIYLDSSDNKYKIKTKTGFAYNAVDNTQNTKTINITATFAGASINRDFEISVSNSAPIIKFDKESTYMTTHPSVNDIVANFTFTDGSAIVNPDLTNVTISIASQDHYNADDTPEGTTESTFGVNFYTTTIGENNAGTGNIYVADTQHVGTHSTGDYIIIEVQASDGGQSSSDTFRVNLTTDTVVDSSAEGQTVQYYYANWSAFHDYLEACNSSTMTSAWELVTLFYEGTNDPMSITSPSTPYADRDLTQSAASGWYKSTAGTVGQWQSDGQSGGGWTVNPITCPQ